MRMESAPGFGTIARSQIVGGHVRNLRRDRYGQIVPESPLIDIQPHAHLLAGASWMAEDGDPDMPARSPCADRTGDARRAAMMMTCLNRELAAPAPGG